MGRRIDFYDDPNAPKATTIVPSVNVVVTNDKDEILLIKRSDNDNWSLPGGAIEIGESLKEAAIREVKEETGIDCEIAGFVGIHSDPKHVILYTSNNEVRQEFSVVLAANVLRGAPNTGEESTEVRWVPKSDIEIYEMHTSMLLRVRHSLSTAKDVCVGHHL